MCEPTTLGLIGTILSAGSSFMQGSAAQSAANANAAAAEENARMARQQAILVEEKKARELTQLNRERSRVMAAQRVAGAGSGMDMGYGSGLGQLQSTAVLAKEDADNLEWNAALEKWGYDAQAAKYDYQAGAARAQGQNAMTMGIIGGAASLAGGLYSLQGGAGKASSFSANAGINPDSYAKMASVSRYGLVAPKWATWNKPEKYVNFGFGR